MIKLIKPYINFEEVEAEFRAVFESGMFTKGSNVDKFSLALSDYTKAKFAFLATSATTALSISLHAMGIKAGDEVIVSDFSFPASVNVIEDIGAVPIFADVSLETYNMLPEELEKKITSKTKAVMFVDALGNPTGVHKIREICRSKKIPLLEDAACAIGSSEAGEKCGKIADLTVFSFHPRKLLTTGEGGAILTDDEKYSNFLKVKLNHGSVVIDGKFDFVDYGYNYRLSELQCVMGYKQIEKLDSIVPERNEIRNQYISALSSSGYTPQFIGADVTYNVQSLVFVVPKNVNRDSLSLYLRENQIESTLGTYCQSATSYYKKKYNDVQKNGLFLQTNTITLPCYRGVDVQYVTETIKKFKKSIQ